MAEDKERDLTLPLIAIGTVVLVSLVVFVVSHFIDKREKPAHPIVEEDTTISSLKTHESEDQLLDIMLFSYVITEACHDKKNNLFLMRVPDHPRSEHWIDAGWYMTPSFEYKILENKTFVITKEEPWNKVTVDVDGLTCKEQPIKPDWFKE